MSRKVEVSEGASVPRGRTPWSVSRALRLQVQECQRASNPWDTPSDTRIFGGQSRNHEGPCPIWLDDRATGQWKWMEKFRTSPVTLAFLVCTLFNKGWKQRGFRPPGASGDHFPLYGGTFVRSYSVSRRARETLIGGSGGSQHSMTWHGKGTNASGTEKQPKQKFFWVGYATDVRLDIRADVLTHKLLPHRSERRK